MSRRRRIPDVATSRPSAGCRLTTSLSPARHWDYRRWPMIANGATRDHLAQGVRRFASKIGFVWFVRPVALPPGRARLRPSHCRPDLPQSGKQSEWPMSPASRQWLPVPPAYDDVYLELTSSAASSAKRSLRPSAQRYSIATATLHPAEFAQPLHKGGDPCPSGRGRALAQEADGRQLTRLLRPRRERPRRRRAAKSA